jgi:hypothetical protein
MTALFVSTDGFVALFSSERIIKPPELEAHPNTGRGTFRLLAVDAAVLVEDKPEAVCFYEETSLPVP